MFLVNIFSKTINQLIALDRFGLDLKHRTAHRTDGNQFLIQGVLNKDDIQRVQQAGYSIEVVSDLIQTAKERTTEISKTNRFIEAREITDFFTRTIMGGYMTVDEIDSALVNLYHSYPSLITLIDLPHKTWEGRTSLAVRLRAGTNLNRVGVLFTGGMHAREWGGSDICISFLVNLVKSYQSKSDLIYGKKTFSADQVRIILENVDLFIFPDVNPDGKNYSQTSNNADQPQNVWWRKNRNPNTEIDSKNSGVDVNRNFDFLWHTGIGTSSKPETYVYKGNSPFSEPEAKNVRFLLDKYNNILYFVDIHSSGEVILYSWGDDDDQSIDPEQNFNNAAYDRVRGIPQDSIYREFLATLDKNTVVGLAERMSNALATVRNRHYTVKQAAGLYPTSGSSDDYAFSRHFADVAMSKVYAYTIEFGTEFVPPYSEMQNIISEVCAAMTELCYAVNSDVWMRDSPNDIGILPRSGYFWNCPDIWVRHQDDGDTVHQDALRGQDNFVYVRVGNRGQAIARNANVRVYATNFVGTEFVYPYDWIPKNSGGGGSLNGHGTYLIGTVTIPELAPNEFTIVKMRWFSSLVPVDTNWHPCLLAEVSPNDGPMPRGEYVWSNNNLGQKCITLLDVPRGGMLDFPFRIGNANSNELMGELELKNINNSTLGGVKVYLLIDETAIIENQGKLKLPLKLGETKWAQLKVLVASDAYLDRVYEIRLEQYNKNQRMIGGITLRLNIVAAPTG